MRRAAFVPLYLAFCLVLGSCAATKRCAYEGGGRNQWQQPDRVIAALELAPGDRVADLGSGSGYFTPRLARAVGPEGRVYATDIDAEINESLRERLAKKGIGNVEIVLADPDDPKLPDGGIDLVFTSDTYHHIQDRTAYFRKLARDLAPGGRVAVVEYDGRKGFVVRWLGHHTKKQELLGEMQEAGYRVVADHDFLDRQSFVVFAPE